MPLNCHDDDSEVYKRAKCSNCDKIYEEAGIMPANNSSRLSNISSDINVVTVAKTKKIVSAFRRSLPTMTIATVSDKIVK